ncbi:MAG: hypothetical protein ACLGJA_24240, partial [Gammaproteobacteria bacterium]
LLHDLVIDFVDIVADHARGLAGAQGMRLKPSPRQPRKPMNSSASSSTSSLSGGAAENEMR